MNLIKNRLKSTNIWSNLRAAKAGASIYSAELLGRIPSKRIRTASAAHLLRMTIDPTAQLYRWREIRSGRNIRIGAGTIIGSDAILDGRNGITIGHSVNLSSQVALWTMQHDLNSPTFATQGGPIVICDRAWVSFRSTILPGVTIGEGAVVAAGAIVTEDVEPYTLVGGVPAKPIGTRDASINYRWRAARTKSPWFL
ncbi:acyltransferase [Rhodococcus sp. D-6]|uniref:Acyltransferase n=1 Tax=Rhodococcus sp. D-6 TaxID=1387842 RepID=A0AAU7USJ8_9NOCA